MLPSVHDMELSNDLEFSITKYKNIDANSIIKDAYNLYIDNLYENYFVINEAGLKKEGMYRYGTQILNILVIFKNFGLKIIQNRF